MSKLRLIAFPSSHPDMALLARMEFAQNIAMGLIFGITSLVILGWQVPGFADYLPPIWSQMKLNTALCMVFASMAQMLSQPGGSRINLRQSRVIAVLVLLIAGSTLYEYVSGLLNGIDTMIPVQAAEHAHGRMAIQIAIYLTLLALTLLMMRSQKRLISRAVDMLIMGLVITTIVILAGYCFGVSQLFGESSFNLTAPQTLVCMALLTFVLVIRRAEQGFFSVLLCVGIGSRMARVMLPFVLIVPFVFSMASAYAMASGVLSAPYAAALTATVSSIVLFSLLVWMAWRINHMERDLRDMSLTDELTRIYNRRGFNLFAEQVMREARRAGADVSVLFYDLDGLKRVNDEYGHDTGSRLLCDFARLLRANFRESDIVARVGGDEFAVVTYGNTAELALAEQRLQERVVEANREMGKPYRIRYSVGEASSPSTAPIPFQDLVTLADSRMYQAKQLKNRTGS